MQHEGQRSKLSQYRRDLAPWGMLLLVALLAVGTVRQALRQYSIQQEINSAQQSVTDLQTKNGQLLDQLSYVKSPTYTEERARLQFGFAKPGEHVAVIPQNLVDAASASLGGTGDKSQSATNSITNNSWKWWQFFFSSK